MSLSIRLVREGRTVADAFRNDHSLQEVSAKRGRLFIGQSLPTPPTWFDFVKDVSTAPLSALHNQSTAAVLFLEVDDAAGQSPRLMALSFGAGHHALEPSAFERSFGLRVTLNSVSRESLRTLDIATLDATTFQRRIQASRDSDFIGFGVDTQRDLLNLASGTPTDASFARAIAGKDVLTIKTITDTDDVVVKCAKALESVRL